jgi:hypothetical protein
MPTIRAPKVRIQDFRPKAKPAGQPVRHVAPPLPSYEPTGLDHLARAMDAEKRQHDAAIRDYSPSLVLAAAADLGRKRYYDRKNPEHRWGMARNAALLRRIYNENLADPEP